MQQPINFPPAPLPGADLITLLTNMLTSILSSRMGPSAPLDIQDGEIWVRHDVTTGVRTVMIRNGSTDVELIPAATTTIAGVSARATNEEGVAGLTTNKTVSPALLNFVMSQFGLFGTTALYDPSKTGYDDYTDSGEYYIPYNIATAYGSPLANQNHVLYVTRANNSSHDLEQTIVRFGGAETPNYTYTRSRRAGVWREFWNLGAVMAQWGGKTLWTGPESAVPAVRDANTIYMWY